MAENTPNTNTFVLTFDVSRSDDGPKIEVTRDAPADLGSIAWMQWIDVNLTDRKDTVTFTLPRKVADTINADALRNLVIKAQGAARRVKADSDAQWKKLAAEKGKEYKTGVRAAAGTGKPVVSQEEGKFTPEQIALLKAAGVKLA
jgi:hypothetical protein